MVQMVLHLFNAYEAFYEKSSAPDEVIKKIIKTIVEISPEAFRLRVKYHGSSDLVLDRVVEKIYRLAIKELEKREKINYIS